MFKTLDHKKGFTLVEVIVTIAIVLVVFGGAIAGFFRFNDRQTVSNTVSEVKQFLESARTRARVRDNPDQAGCMLQGYKVETVGTDLSMKILCGPGKFNVNEGAERDTLTIPPGITVTSMDVTYYTLLGSADVNAPGTGEIRVNGDNSYYLFEVRDSGEITEGCFVTGAESTTCIN